MRARMMFRPALIIADAVLLYAILYVLSIFRTNVEFVTEYWYRSFLPIGVTCVVLNVIGAYNRLTDMRSLSYTSKHLVTMPIAMVVTLVLIYLFSYKPSLQFSRSVFIASYSIFFFISLGYRRALYARMSGIRRKHFFVVLGVDEAARELYHASCEHNLEQSLVFVDLSGLSAGKHIIGEQSPVIQTKTILFELDHRCEGIILTGAREQLTDDVFALLVKLHFKDVSIISVKSFYEEHFRKIPLFALGKWWLVEDDLLLVRNPFFPISKQAVDSVIGALGCIVGLPLMVLIGIAVRLESRGPAIYKQRRLGYREAPFTMYKFRSMYVDADASDLYAHSGDKRITRVGRFLRRSRLDELPQLWNVMRGEMSMIGPRAEWVEVVKNYQENIPFYHIRLAVKPGITGWAQVNYKYGENIKDTIEKLQYDLYYISRFSLMLDIDIVLKTLYVMVAGKGT